MAFSLGRAAGAGLRRSATAVGGAGGAFRCSATPAVGLGGGLRPSATPLVGSAPRVFANTRFYASSRTPDAPLQEIKDHFSSLKKKDHFEGWSAEKLIYARTIIDSKLAEKGVKVLSTGRDARQESRMKTVSNQLNHIQMEVSHIKNKKGELTAINIGNARTLNLMLVLTILLTVEEVYPMLPVIVAWVKSIL